MQLPYDLVNKFTTVSIASPYEDKNRKVAEYGTIKKVNDNFLVQIDGSNIMTPFISVSDVRDEERVKVEVVGHQAIVTGNMTNPSVGVNTFNEEVDRIDGDMTDMDIQIHKDLADVRKEAEEERKKIKEALEAAKKKAEEDAKEAYDHATAASKVSTDYIEAVPGQGFFVGAAKNHEHPYNVFINAAGIQIRHGYDSNATVLSKWDASQLVIGQSDKFHSTMKVNEFKISQGDVDYMSLDLTGLTLNTSDKKPYAKYSTTGFQIGYDGNNKLRLIGNNTDLKFVYKNASGVDNILASYSMDGFQVGAPSGKQLIGSSSGITLKDNGKNTAQFTETKFSFAEGKGLIIYDPTNKIDNISWNGTDLNIPGLILSSTDLTKGGIELRANKDIYLRTNTANAGSNAPTCNVLQRSTSTNFSYNIYATAPWGDVTGSWVSYWGTSNSWIHESNNESYNSRFEVKKVHRVNVAQARWIEFQATEWIWFRASADKIWINGSTISDLILTPLSNLQSSINNHTYEITQIKNRLTALGG